MKITIAYARLHYIKKIDELGNEERKILTENNEKTYVLRKEKKKLKNPDIIEKTCWRTQKNKY